MISAAALRESLRAGAWRPCVLEVGWRARPDGDFDGIPGALPLDTDALETPGPAWRLRPLVELQALLERLGLGADTPVVIVSRRAIAAARVWWVLRYLGLPDVRVLDGGSRAWRSVGSPPIDAFRPPHRALPCRAIPALIARGRWLRAQLAVPGAIRLVDVRSREEFVGERSGYGYLAARGRIPGAVHGGDADDSAGLYIQRDGFLQDPAVIRALWTERGILQREGSPSAGELVFSCGGGWRSSLACLYAEWLGIPRWRNHSGGWSEWSTRFRRDSRAGAPSPGWRQSATGNPIVRES